MNHQCLSAAPEERVHASGPRGACFLKTHAIQLGWWNYIPVSNELHASSCVINKLSQTTPQLHECSDLRRCVPRSQKQPHHHATQYSVREEAVLLHLRKGNPQAARNISCLQELSGKSKCNSLQYPGTWLGEDPGSYLNPWSFPLLLLELLQLPRVRYAKEPGDKAVRSS